MTRVRRVAGLFYPLLFAAALALGIAARSAGQFRAADFAVVLAAVLAAAALAVVVAVAAVRAVDRSDRAEPLAAALAMVAVAWFFYYAPAQLALEGVTWRFSRDRVLVPLGLLATAALVAWLVRQRPERLVTVNAFMARFGLLLVAVIAVNALVARSGEPRAAARSALARELARPVRTVGAPPPGRNTPPRDIYLIVTDGHASSRVLREVLGFDNTAFEDSLRALGFVVPARVRSNYTQTVTSLTSLLNAAHVTGIAKDVGETTTDFTLPKHLVANNRVARFLKARGYRYVLFPSAWWNVTEHSPLADVEFDARPEFRLADEVRRTELRLAVLRSTLLRNAFRRARGDADFYRRTFAGLREVPADTTPTFTFAHVLLPHIPYVFDERCRPLASPIPSTAEDDSPAQRAAYLRQLRCVDSMVLDLVTTLLRRSATPPIILVVGDHGSRFTDVHYYERPDRVSPAFVRERFGVLGAFYLPAGGAAAFEEPVSLVNVMGNVLRYYFNAALPRSSDEMYVSGERPYRFYRVDASQYSGR